VGKTLYEDTSAVSDSLIHSPSGKNFKFGKGNGAVDYEALRMLKNTFEVQEKYDGARFMLIGEIDTTKFRSRVVSKKTGELGNKSANFPHLRVKFPGLVMDGEIVVPGGDSSDAMSAVGALPEQALSWQRENGKVYYVAFDLLFFGTKDVRHKPYHSRRRLLKEIVAQLGNKYILSARTWNHDGRDAARLFKRIVKGGGEGVMIKDPSAAYGKGVWKVKSFRDTCVIITGFTEGEKKYVGQIGAVKFSVWSNNKLIEIGQCSGFDDELRKDFTKNQKRFIGKVMEVRGNKLTSHCRLRHPRFQRFRDHDYAPEQCTMKKLKQDFG